MSETIDQGNAAWLLVPRRLSKPMIDAAFEQWCKSDNETGFVETAQMLWDAFLGASPPPPLAYDAPSPQDDCRVPNEKAVP